MPILLSLYTLRTLCIWDNNWCSPTQWSKCLHERWARLQLLKVSKLKAYYPKWKTKCRSLHGKHPFSYPTGWLLGLSWLKAAHAWGSKSPGNDGAASQRSLGILRASAHQRQTLKFCDGKLVCHISLWVCHHECKIFLWEGEGRKASLLGEKKISAEGCLGRCVPSGGCLVDDA